MKFFFDSASLPWLTIDPDPADPGNDAGGGVVDPDPNPEIEQLRREAESYKGIVEKLRPIERQYKRLEALVGTTDPEKLQELRDAEQRYQQSQSDVESKVLEARNAVTADYEGQLKELNTKVQQYETKAQQQATEYELFRAFNSTEGEGPKFKSFVKLAGEYFERDSSGNLKVHDENGAPIIYSDKTTGDRAASPEDFMKMLVSGELDEKYRFSDIESLKRMFAPYNKAMGAGLPTRNGVPSGKALQDMSQAELGKLAFKA